MIIWVSGSGDSSRRGEVSGEMGSFSLNSCWCSGSHLKSLFLPSSCLIAAVAWEKSGMKNDSCCASPRNERTPVTFVGGGNFLIASTLSGSGLTPSLLTM